MLDRVRLARRGRRLEYFTIGWNSLEGLIAIGAGVVAGSISLVGFGVDSFIEVTSGAALLWRMAADADEARREYRERLALRIVGVCFLTLAAYVIVEALNDLRSGSVSDTSVAGIVLACASLVVMPVLSWAKRRVGSAMGSQAMTRTLGKLSSVPIFRASCLADSCSMPYSDGGGQIQSRR
jgi:divalent metal cation (Fe/Co/Zn/Cd) transporter